MEVTNILDMKAYGLTVEDKVLVIKNSLAQEGFQLIKTCTNEEKEKCKTVKPLFNPW